MNNIFSMEQKFSSLPMKKGAEKHIGPDYKRRDALPWTMGRPRRKSNSRPVVRCLFQCLMLKLCPDILKWVNEKEYTFSILFKHKKSPDWTANYLEFCKKLDSLSPKKRVKYANEKDPEQCSKRRCKANLQKLRNDGIIEYIRTDVIDKCTKIFNYKFLEIPCDDDFVKKKKSLGNDLVHEEIILRNEDFSLLVEKYNRYDNLNELMELTHADEGKKEDDKHLMNDNVLGIVNSHETDEDFANMNIFTKVSDCQMNNARENCHLSAQDRIENRMELVPTKEYGYHAYADIECTHSMFAYDRGKHSGEKDFYVPDSDLPSCEGSVDIGHLLTAIKMSDGVGGLNSQLTPLLSSGTKLSFDAMDLDEVAEKL